MSDSRQVALSKLLALLLRHRSADYGLHLDPEGFVPLDALLAVINKQRGWYWVRAEHIERLLAEQTKRRYELVDGDIRAIYGHSQVTAIQYEAIVPPALLLHGTARRFVDAILRDGLRPMNRQYVHLTDEFALAELTGKRRDPRPAIIRIDAQRAHAAGLEFYRADQGVFLTRHVPAEFLSV